MTKADYLKLVTKWASKETKAHVRDGIKALYTDDTSKFNSVLECTYWLTDNQSMNAELLEEETLDLVRDAIRINACFGDSECYEFEVPAGVDGEKTFRYARVTIPIRYSK